MQAVLARLEGSPALDATVKRSHRTTVTREDAPMIHLVDGDDVPEDSDGDCDKARTKHFTVSVFVRSDTGASAADALVLAVNDRLNPADAYGDGVRLRQGPITPDEEIADEDAVRIDMKFRFLYNAPGWNLDA